MGCAWSVANRPMWSEMIVAIFWRGNNYRQQRFDLMKSAMYIQLLLLLILRLFTEITVNNSNELIWIFECSCTCWCYLYRITAGVKLKSLYLFVELLLLFFFTFLPNSRKYDAWPSCNDASDLVCYLICVQGEGILGISWIIIRIVWSIFCSYIYNWESDFNFLWAI